MSDILKAGFERQAGSALAQPQQQPQPQPQQQ